MHNALIAATFILMLVSPCIVAMRSGATKDRA